MRRSRIRRIPPAPALILALVAGHLWTATAAAQAPPWHAALDSIVDSRDRPDSPGCALGVVEAGTLTYSNAYGIADLDHLIPNTPETVFDIGSASKQFTAAAVMLAARSGLLSLDDDIRKWMPGLPDYGTPITIRHLLAHTSGLRDHVQLFAIADGDMTSDAAVLAMITRQRGLNFPPGSEHLYSNTGYFLLSQIVTRAAGMPFADYAHREIFAPLAMNATHVHADAGRVVPGRAWGYTPVDGGFRMGFPVHGGIVGTGGVYSTVPDLARWVVALLHDGIGGEGFTAAMLESGALTNGDTVSYAAGLNLGRYRGLRTVFHGGASVGFRSGIVNFPDAETSLIALCNSRRTDAVRRARELADIVLADRLAPATAAPAGETAPRRNEAPTAFLSLADDELGEYEGYYFSPELDHGYAFVAQGGDLALLRLAGAMPFAPIARDVFGTRNGWARVSFTRNGDGQLTGYVMDIGRVDGLIFERRGGVQE